MSKRVTRQKMVRKTRHVLNRHPEDCPTHVGNSVHRANWGGGLGEKSIKPKPGHGREENDDGERQNPSP